MRLAVTLAAAATLAACAGSAPIGQSPAVTAVAAGELPAPTRPDMNAATRPYLIGPFDRLKIDVFGAPELSSEVQVDSAAQFTYPFIGTVAASGRTPAEVADAIAGRLRGRYVRNPQVSVNLVASTSQVITVDGDVVKPGQYPVTGDLTLLRAVATAGGATEYAKLDEVLIFRTVKDQRMVAAYSLKAIRRGNYVDPAVYPADLIVVGDSPSKRLLGDVLARASLITTPLVLLLR